MRSTEFDRNRLAPLPAVREKTAQRGTMQTNFMRERPDKNRRPSSDGGDLPLNDISPHIREQIPGYVVRTDRVVPVGLEGDVLVVAMEDPDDTAIRERIRFI